LNLAASRGYPAVTPSRLKEKWSRKARELSADSHALYLAARDPRVPWYAKLLAAVVVAYAVSPVDLIPDFIPVIGLLDDMIIVPLGLALAYKMIPREVMEEHRREARGRLAKEVPRRWTGAAVVICIWILLLWLVAYPIVRRLSPH
jgi:uncharacterized membrane protein YkvA (DUF1232 family)